MSAFKFRVAIPLLVGHPESRSKRIVFAIYNFAKTPKVGKECAHLRRFLPHLKYETENNSPEANR
jgi:hypothetical protein